MNAQQELTAMQIMDAATIVPVADMGKALDFYTRVLGFNKDFEAEGEFAGMYAGVRNGPVSLHLSAFPGTDLTASTIYITCKDVDAVHAELKARGAKLDAEPVNQPYGMRDFMMQDPFGNHIGFGTPLGDCSGDDAK